MDVTESASVAAMVEAVEARHGRIDIAFNNAGILGGRTPTGEYDEEEWNNVLAVNLTSVFLPMKYEIAHMSARGRGVIVNSISPGAIETPMTYLPGESREERDARLTPGIPLGRVATPEEIAASVLWLASPESGFVVGQDYVIDEGATA